MCVQNVPEGEALLLVLRIRNNIRGNELVIFPHNALYIVTISIIIIKIIVESLFENVSGL